MAQSILCTNGNAATSTTWASVDSTSLLNSETGNTALGSTPGTGTDTATFILAGVTCDGIALKIATRTATPAGNTMTVLLRLGGADVAGTTVTVDAADIDASGLGWHFFKFSSPVSLTGTYLVRAYTNNANVVNCYRDSTAANWSRMLRTTTTASPSANDQLYIMGELTGNGTGNTLTCTWNLTTATNFGATAALESIEVSRRGRLVADMTASQAYGIAWKGPFKVRGGGVCMLGNTVDTSSSNSVDLTGNKTFSAVGSGLTYVTGQFVIVMADANNWMQGTVVSYSSTTLVITPTVATGSGTFTSWLISAALTSSSTFTMLMNTAASLDTWIDCNGGGHFITRGSPLTYVYTKLAADASSSATSITTADSTGWLKNPTTAQTTQLVFSSTTTTTTQGEVKAITANASGTGITIAALTNAHSGTNDANGDARCEVGNLTRNIIITATSQTFTGYLAINSTALWDMQYTEVSFMGSATAGKQGIVCITSAGALTNIQYCSEHDFLATNSQGFLISGSTTGGSFNFTNNIIYNTGTFGIQQTALIASTFDSNLIITCPTGISSSTQKIICTNNLISGCTGSGIIYSGTDGSPVAFNGNVMHSNSSGFSPANTIGSTFSSCRAWRNGTAVNINNSSGVFTATLDSWIIFGNSTAGVGITVCRGGEILLKSCVFNGGVAPFTIQPTGLLLQNSLATLTCDSCTFGSTTAHSTGDINVSVANFYQQVYLNNCLLATTTELANQTNLPYGSFISSQKHDQTTGLHKTWMGAGTLSIDTVIFNIASPSLRMTPLSAALKLESASPRRGWLVPILNGTTATISVYIRRSVVGDGTAYNGNAPRLIVRKNVALGISADTVLATSVAAAGNWELLSGTSSSVTDDGALEIICDCDGTTGWVNVDDRTAA